MIFLTVLFNSFTVSRALDAKKRRKNPAFFYGKRIVQYAPFSDYGTLGSESIGGGAFDTGGDDAVADGVELFV